MATASAPYASPLEHSLDQLVQRGITLIEEVRRVRAERQLKPRDEVVLHLDGETGQLITALDGLVERLAGVSEVSADPPPTSAATATFEGRSFAIHTSGGCPSANKITNLWSLHSPIIGLFP